MSECLNTKKAKKNKSMHGAQSQIRREKKGSK